ncbi:hypothetical protein PCANB_000040 [Pneumocystis canis]|nr:hypothetical protein PCK1_000146 [Pneumocystis canis]KAG5439758.1 hypothetical protein PCANB_000040 [Pneumocystis canis]
MPLKNTVNGSKLYSKIQDPGYLETCRKDVFRPMHEEDSGFQYVRTRHALKVDKNEAKGRIVDNSQDNITESSICIRMRPTIKTSHTSYENTSIRFSEHTTDSYIELPTCYTPVIEKNRDLRQRRRSSLGFRGKRASSILANGSMALPHPSISHENFFKHISEDLPEPMRMKQLLIWCAKRALDEQKENGTCKDTHAASLAYTIEEEILKDLMENKLSVSWYHRQEEDPSLKPKPHPRNVENRKKIKEFELKLSKLKEELNTWNKLEMLFLSSHAKNTTDNTLVIASDASQNPLDSIIDGALDDTILPSKNIEWIPSEKYSELITWLKSQEENLEFKIDQLYYSLHLIDSFVQVSNQYATQLLGNIAKAIQEREQQTQIDLGSSGMSIKDVLKAITRQCR